jgi:hypothetical protein
MQWVERRAPSLFQPDRRPALSVLDALLGRFLNEVSERLSRQWDRRRAARPN